MLTKTTDVFIVEDDFNALDYLKNILDDNFPHLNLIGEATSVSEAVSSLNSVSPSLVFMDIELPDGNSFDILDQIKQKDFEIIFITAHDQFYKEAFKYFALSYLQKPFILEDLKEVIQKFRQRTIKILDSFKTQQLKSFLNEHDSKFLIQVGHDFESISINKILKLEADGNFTKFHCKDKNIHYASNSLKNYYNILKFKGFIRVNRFTAINVSHIKTIKKKQYIVLSNGDKINISSHYRHTSILKFIISIKGFIISFIGFR